MLAPHQIKSVALRPGNRKQHALATLKEAFRAVLNTEEFKRRLGEMHRSTDVVWSVKDPLPFLLSLPLACAACWRAASLRVTYSEASQQDIAWRPGNPSRTESSTPDENTSAVPEAQSV